MKLLNCAKHTKQIRGTPLKISPNDNKAYRSLCLDNGLRVVLVEAQDSHKSACSLVVNTGHFDDPHDRPGFAHFVEHLLFNGNEKYPEPNAINNFMSKHGGHCNAWTGTEHSCYFFDIQPDWFFEGLDYFAHLFVDPCFSDTALNKEQDAIHSEYKLKLKDDSRRIQQVHKQTCNPAHPFHKFSVGNRHTLSDLPQRPVVNELKAYWQGNYQARYMTLCLVSQHSLDKMQEKVKRLFDLLPDFTAQPEKPSISVPLYREQDLGIFIGIKPVKELHRVNLTFPMPDMSYLYKNKMLSFIAHLIGHEGKGSLFEELKDLGFINALSAGNGISGGNFKDFNISMDLTELGEQSLDQILEVVFSYISFLKAQTPGEFLYLEQKALTEISFEFQEEIKPNKLANQIALNMQHYPEQDYLSGDYRMDGLDLDAWQQVFEYFVADSLRITLVSQAIEPTRQAAWYHTPYCIETISPEQIASLNGQIAKPKQFQLPCPNPYLSEDIYLETADFTSPIPISLVHDFGWQCWFKQDISFRVPKGNIYLGLDLPLGIKTKRNQALMRLFCDLFMDTVSEQHYQAEMAGLHYNVYAHNAGITLYTSGLSNCQHELLLTLIDSMFNTPFSTQRFHEVKRQLIKHWGNSESNKPISQLFSILNSQLIPSMASSFELAQELETVEFNEFVEFRNYLFDQSYAEVLLYGNWNTAQAISINQQIRTKFTSSTPVSEIDRVITELNRQGIVQFTKAVEHDDSAAALYVQGMFQSAAASEDVLEKALFILTSQILAPFSFNYLRMEKQLGYLAGSGYMPLCNTPGLVLYVQSHDQDSQFLATNLTNCLDAFLEEISEMTSVEFEKHKTAVIHQYEEQPSNLNQKCQQLWVCIGNKDYTFSQRQEIVAELQQIQLSQLVKWCDANLNPSRLSAYSLRTLNQTASA